MKINDVKYIQSEIAEEDGQKGLFKMPEQIPTAKKRYKFTAKKKTDFLEAELQHLKRAAAASGRGLFQRSHPGFHRR